MDNKGSFEIVRTHSRSNRLYPLYMAGQNVNYIVHVLHLTFNQQVWLSDKREAALFEHIRHYDDIRDAGFILHTEEHNSFRGARTLPHNHAPRHAHKAAVRNFSEFLRWSHAEFVHFRTEEMHRVASNGETGTVVIRGK